MADRWFVDYRNRGLDRQCRLCTSLAFDASGNPHISYYDWPNGDLKHAWQSGGSWHTETVDSTGNVGLYTSLAFDTSGNPHISYYDNTNGDLKHARKSGGVWYNEIVDSACDVTEYNSLAFDASGNPHISYYDYTNEDLKYASATLAPPNTIGYSATVTGGQNTVIQSSNGAFCSIPPGSSATISPSVVLNNTGDAAAKVEARFTTNVSGLFGMLSGSNVLNASKFEIGPTGSLVALNDDGIDVQVATAPVGITNLDAKLSVPALQAPGEYSGTVILMFSNA